MNYINPLNYLRSLFSLNRLPKLNIRIHNKPHDIPAFKEKNVAQAKTLTDKELRKVLNYIAIHKHAARNRAMLLITHWAGMRVGEVSALRIFDVFNEDFTCKDEIRLSREQTKGRHARSVFLAEKLRKELITYLATIDRSDPTKPLFSTQKSVKFSSNSLCQHFFWQYRNAGIDGASSHSGRRGFLSSLSSKSVPLKVLMELAGHRQAQTTMRYVDVTADMKRAAVELI